MKSVLLKKVPAGRRHRGRVLDVSTPRRQGVLWPVMVIEDLTSGEGHVLIGGKCCDARAKKGDEGTLTFIHDAAAPTGGYWQFRKD